MKVTVKQVHRKIDQVAAAFVSPSSVPAEASELEAELAEDADQLLATVAGGLGTRSVSTGAVTGGIKEAEALLSTYKTVMTPAQTIAVRDLLETLRVV